MRTRGTKDEFIPTRRSLLSRLKNWDDQESWRDFFNTYWRLLYSVALKARLTESEAQDAVQETVISVAKSLPGFKYDPEVCSFKTWLRTITQRRIVDQFRKRLRRRHEADTGQAYEIGELPVEEIPDPASLNLDKFWDEEYERNLFQVALERVKVKVNAEHYQVFDLLVLREMPVAKVAGLLHVSRAQVYLIKHRLTKLVQAEVDQLKEKMI